MNKYEIPPTFQEILSDFTLQILKDQPENIYEYGAQFFAAYDEEREFIYQPNSPIKNIEREAVPQEIIEEAKEMEFEQ